MGVFTNAQKPLAALFAFALLDDAKTFLTWLSSSLPPSSKVGEGIRTGLAEVIPSGWVGGYILDTVDERDRGPERAVEDRRREVIVMGGT